MKSRTNRIIYGLAIGTIVLFEVKVMNVLKDGQNLQVQDISQSFVRSNNTIVTAYYQLKTKRHNGRNDYFELMRNLFSNDDPMIIFTSHDLVANLTTIRHQRPPNRTLVSFL